jgi:hypothetical protein
VPASLAQAQEGAQKVPLEHLRNVDCQGHQLSPGVGTNGFALIHENGVENADCRGGA